MGEELWSCLLDRTKHANTPNTPIGVAAAQHRGSQKKNMRKYNVKGRGEGAGGVGGSGKGTAGGMIQTDQRIKKKEVRKSQSLSRNSADPLFTTVKNSSKYQGR